MVFTIFSFLVDEKIKLKVLASFFEIIETPSSNPPKGPEAAIQEAALDSVKSYRSPPVTS
jgi:hypothetical protein